VTLALTLLLIVVLAALIFDFINGFHDAANAIATTVATGAMGLGAAVVLSGVCNFAGAMMGTEVAKFFVNGFVNDPLALGQVAVLSALVGASIWNLLTWWWGLPSSSSHALIGGIAGAVVVGSGWDAFNWMTLLKKPILWLVLSPLIGFIVAFVTMIGLYWVFCRSRASQVDRWSRGMQIASGAAFSVSHGLNDAQKVMGIITLGMITYLGVVQASGSPTGLPDWVLPHQTVDAKGKTSYGIPYWVMLSCAIAIGLGTMAGGKRIIKTMGAKLTRISPAQGLAAQTSGTATLFATAAWGIPVSTTHCINAAVLGAGSAHRFSAVRWGVVANILVAWVLTIPASAAMAAITYVILRSLIGQA
jgi:PiT family inorganic phosphate transporter